MQRDELLDLLLLEADGSLSKSDAALLNEELSRDPALRDERARMQVAWGELRELGRSVAMSPDFGENRLAALRAPRREGVLIGGQVRAAAAALLLATFLRGAFDPRSSIVFERGDDADASTSARKVGVLPSGSSIATTPRESVRVAAIDGLRCTMREGAVELNADGVVRIEPGPADIDIEIGERTARIDLGDVVLFGANTVLHVASEPFLPRQFDIVSGSVRVGGFAGRRISRRDGAFELGPDGGLIAVAPSSGSATGSDSVTGAARRETAPATIDHPENPSGNADPTVATVRDVPLAHLFGVVSTSDEGVPLPGTTLRLTPDLLPSDRLDAILPSDPAERLAALRDLDVARAALGMPLTILTDEDGRYDLPRVAPGIWRVDVLSPAKPQRADIAGRFVQVPAGGEVALDFRLEAGATANGRVSDRYGHSIAGAMVDDGSRSVITDHNGKFVLHNAPLSGVAVVVHAEGFEELATTLQMKDTNRISLATSTKIRGVIRDAAGETLLGRIEAGFELDGTWRVARANVERDGEFELRAIPFGVPVLLVASSDDHQSATTFLEAAADRDGSFDFTLASSDRVKILPYDVAYGRPIGTATVLALSPSELVAGVEQSDESITLDGLDASATNHAITWAPGLRYTAFDVFPNVGVIHVDLQPARARHLRVRDDLGNELADALVVWGARPRDSNRFLALVPAVRDDDGFTLPDFGLDGVGLTAQIIVVANGETVVLVDDPMRDETVVAVSADN
jgi:hypothetical protein